MSLKAYQKESETRSLRGELIEDYDKVVKAVNAPYVTVMREKALKLLNEKLKNDVCHPHHCP